MRLTEATPVPAATAGAIRAPHCRVNGIIGSEIRFTLLLPDDWNRKFFMGGGGGFVGSVQNTAQTTVNLGYATVGTDTGHQAEGTDASWALNNWVENGKAPERVTARKLASDGAVMRTRPLCPYPQRAEYVGSGSTDDEKNFVCR